MQYRLTILLLFLLVNFTGVALRDIHLIATSIVILAIYFATKKNATHQD